MRFLIKVLVFVILFTPMLRLNGTLAQTSDTHKLPNDIVFTVSDEMPGPFPANRNTLALVSADTLELVEFYSDEDADEVRAISWSPQGDKLAVWHVYYDEDTNIGITVTCIISISGESQVCFDDVPDLPSGAIPYTDAYYVDWSDDGQTVYLVVEDGEILNLVEQDAATGATLRTIFQYKPPLGERPTIVAWSPRLHYVAAGIGYDEEAGVLINVETGEEQDLSQIVVPWFGGQPQDAPPHAGYVCNSFSPQGSYMTAIDYSDFERGDRLIVFDMELEEVASITAFNTPEAKMSLDGCPTWNDNEDRLYIYARSETDQTRHIFIYSLTDDQIISHFESDAFYPPLLLSPSQTHVAFVGFTSWYQVNILNPDGEVWQVTDQYTFSGYPLWRPSPQ